MLKITFKRLTDCDDQSSASSDTGNSSEFDDECDSGSELGFDGSGPCEEEGEQDLFEEDGDLL